MLRRAFALATGAALLLCCGPGRDRTPPDQTGTTEAEIRVRAYTLPYELDTGLPGAGQTWLIVDVDVLAKGSRTIAASFDKFSLETNAASYAALGSTPMLDNGCDDSSIARPSQSRFCRVAFAVNAGETPRTLYLAVTGAPVAGSFDGILGPPALCAVRGPEDSVAACTDGCNNDGDGFMDCEDRDCCPLIGGCPSNTYCGRNQPECVAGAEGAFTTCLDRCDNDDDGAMDCNEAACCDVLVCGSQTVCGVMGDPFTGSFRVDDTAVADADPNTLLAGASPCRAPALVRVVQVPDGDTLRISSVDGSDLDGLLRLIGVDTPEIGRNGDPSDCYAEEAREFARSVDGRLAWITFDAECRDQYDRYLGYAFFGPERSDLLQRQLVRRGLARVYSVRGNDSLAEIFTHDETLAISGRVGLHAACQ
jgi:endonuclease YncB( thermonuclease family)